MFFYSISTKNILWGRESTSISPTVHLDSESETSDDDENIASPELLKETSDCKLTRFDLQAIIFNFIYFYKLYNVLDFTKTLYTLYYLFIL